MNGSGEERQICSADVPPGTDCIAVFEYVTVTVFSRGTVSANSYHSCRPSGET